MIRNLLGCSAGFVILAILSACNSGSTAAPNNASYYASLCESIGGYYQYGTVNSPPNSDYMAVTNYAAATESLAGIPLSHTHIEITSALDGKIYDVAIDNVFANGYNPLSYVVPSTYAENLTAGSTLYLCSGNPRADAFPEIQLLCLPNTWTRYPRENASSDFLYSFLRIFNSSSVQFLLGLFIAAVVLGCGG